MSQVSTAMVRYYGGKYLKFSSVYQISFKIGKMYHQAPGDPAAGPDIHILLEFINNYKSLILFYFSQKGKQFNTGIGFTIDFLYFHPPVFNSLSGHRGKKNQNVNKIFHFITKQFKLAYSLEKWKHVLKSYDYMFK